ELNPRNSSRSVIKKAEEHVAHRQSEKRNAENQTDDEPPRHVREFGVLCLHGCSYARLKGHATDRTGAGLFANYLRVHRADVLDLVVRGRRKFGFQSHSAGWTGVRSGRVNLGAHGTDVFGRALGGMRSFDRANATPFPRGWRKRRLCDWSDRRLGPELNHGAAHGVDTGFVVWIEVFCGIGLEALIALRIAEVIGRAVVFKAAAACCCGINHHSTDRILNSGCLRCDVFGFHQSPSFKMLQGPGRCIGLDSPLQTEASPVLYTCSYSKFESRIKEKQEG